MRGTTPGSSPPGRGPAVGRGVGRMIRLATTLILLTTAATAQQPTTPTRVTEVTFGQFGGRGEANLPNSVLGLPDTTGREEVAATDPKQILSLGLDGTITLEFVDHYVTDGPGADITVFENPFLYRLGDRERVYAEPGEVSVSRDGVTWHAFPFDSLTLVGAAGVTPTNGDADPYDPEVSGGDHFDLATIGADSIRFVRVRDVTRVVLGNREHPLYDATLNGFDLDAVVAHHVVADAFSLGVDLVERADLVRVRVVGDRLRVGAKNFSPLQTPRVSIYSITGRRVIGPLALEAGTSSLSIASLPSGGYFVVVGDGIRQDVARFVRW